MARAKLEPLPFVNDGECGQYSTFVRTEDGKAHDLGRGQRPPIHDHERDKVGTCPECRIVDAFTARYLNS